MEPFRSSEVCHREQGRHSLGHHCKADTLVAQVLELFSGVPWLCEELSGMGTS